MNALPPAHHLTLTAAQERRLALLDDDCTVIGQEGRGLVVRHATGHLSIIGPDGTACPATCRARERMTQRAIDFVLPRVA